MDDQALTYARRVLLTSLVIVGMGFSVLFPLLAPIGREMGLSEFQITSIIGASSLAVFLASPIWGTLKRLPRPKACDADWLIWLQRWHYFCLILFLIWA